MKKNLGPIFFQRGQNRSQNQVFYHFLKYGSLVFLQIAYNDSLQQYLTCSPGKIREKTFWGPKSVPKLGFPHFLKFRSLVFLEITYNDSLQQCLTTSRAKHIKEPGAQIWAKWPKIGPKIRFFVTFSSLVHQFSWKWHRMIA